ncbi:uncharacterized protein AB9W97_012118 isoform 2-T4 [Spinachia spinachia]
MEKESHHSCNGWTASTSPSSGKPQPGRAAAALLKAIRFPPEAQRILGTSRVPVVSLKRLNLRSVRLSSLQPVVSLVRLPRRGPVELNEQNGVGRQGAKPSEAAEMSLRDHCGQSETAPTPWTEPYCPDGSPCGEPEQDSGFDCDSNPDQAYILFDSGSDDWDPEGRTDSATFYLDPDPEQTMVIELDPDPDRGGCPQLEDAAGTECEEVQMDDSRCERAGLRCSPKKEEEEEEEEEDSSSIHRPEPGSEETESEDFCAVCRNGGDLLCCDRCPKVYHLACHVPALCSFPLGDWACTLCRPDQEPVDTYECENEPSGGGVGAPYALSGRNQRARNYYQIIKRPIDLSVICRKLDKSNTLHYFTAQQFVDDVLLMFNNCATFNYPDSEVAQAGRSLHQFFARELKDVFPDLAFPSTSRGWSDGSRLRRLCRKRRENHRKRRFVFSGKKYYL